MPAIFIYCTSPTFEEAEKIAAALLDQKLIACANIMAPHTALYRWQGQVERAQEFTIIMKTSSELFEKVRKMIVGMHSYECPCIVSWPIDAGHAPFLDWIKTETLS